MKDLTQRKHNARRKNRHGRKGVKTAHLVPVDRRTGDMNAEEYKHGWKAGYKAGRQDAITEELEFLQVISEKRNAKDIKGLVEKRMVLRATRG